MNTTTVWTLSLVVSYKDNTVQNMAIVKDFGPPNFIGGTIDDFLELAFVDTLSAFFTAMGFVPEVTVTPDPNIREIAWRFQAITTNGEINVVGSDNEMDGEILSNDLEAALAALNEDSTFFDTFMTISSQDDSSSSSDSSNSSSSSSDSSNSSSSSSDSSESSSSSSDSSESSSSSSDSSESSESSSSSSSSG